VLIEATTGFRPNGVEFVLAEVHKHSGVLSDACDFSMYHHRIITGLDLTGLFPKGFVSQKKPNVQNLSVF
jgi:hypothetical protein